MMIASAALHHSPACQRLPLLALQANPDVGLLLESAEDGRQQKKEDEPLRCRFCMQPVCHRDSAVARDGSHLHTRSNPAGLVFTIGLFAEAPGCEVFGPLSMHFSWFAGYGWEVASCRRCFSHLGWRFRNDGSDHFFGLIVAHLADGL